MPPIDSLPVTPLQRDPPCVVIWLRGEHDISTMAELSETIARAIVMSDADLVVDLADVEFMGAATVGVLSRARALLRTRSRSLMLRSPSTCARRVLELCGHADLLDRRAAVVPPPTRLAAPATVSSVLASLGAP